jgi:hypothetical protein
LITVIYSGQGYEINSSTYALLQDTAEETKEEGFPYPLGEILSDMKDALPENLYVFGIFDCSR